MKFTKRERESRAAHPYAAGDGSSTDGHAERRGGRWEEEGNHPRRLVLRARGQPPSPPPSPLASRAQASPPLPLLRRLANQFVMVLDGVWRFMTIHLFSFLFDLGVAMLAFAGGYVVAKRLQRSLFLGVASSPFQPPFSPPARVPPLSDVDVVVTLVWPPDGRGGRSRRDRAVLCPGIGPPGLFAQRQHHHVVPPDRHPSPPGATHSSPCCCWPSSLCSLCLLDGLLLAELHYRQRPTPKALSTAPTPQWRRRFHGYDAGMNGMMDGWMGGDGRVRLLLV